MNSNMLFIVALVLNIRLAESNHTDLYVEPELRQAAVVLESLCDNFLECGIDKSYYGSKLCCIKCSCEPTCAVSHSCCPESGYHPTTDVPYTTGQEGMTCRNPRRIGDSPLGVFRSPEYEFLEWCPMDTPADIKSHCEEAFTAENVSVIGSLPLYDTLRGINYANKYCAMCNNALDGNLVPWKPVVTCGTPDGSSAMTLTDIEELLVVSTSNKCTLNYEPPDVTHTTFCYADVITTCNVTGNWMTYDDTTVQFCDKLDIVYVTFQGQTYKNVFCALCNAESIYFMMPQSCPFADVLDFTSDFTAILQFSLDDIDEYTDTQRTVRTDGCTGNFAMDPLMGRCMPLYCFTPDVLDMPAFQCKNLFGKTNKAIAGFTFSIEFQKVLNFSGAQDKGQEISSQVKGALQASCFVSIFYKTSLSVIDSLDDIDITATSEVFTGLHVRLGSRILDTFPEEEMSTIRQSTESICTNISSCVYMGPESIDPGMLRYIAFVDTGTLESRDDVAMFDLTGPSHYLFQDPYTKTVVIGMQNSAPWYCGISIYNNEYISCPSFRYNITRFSKTPSGLNLIVNGANVVFGFDEFKTADPDATEVSICSQSVIDKVSYPSSSQAASFSSLYPLTLTFILALKRCITIY